EAPTLALPRDHPRPARQTYAAEVWAVPVPAATRAAVQALGQAHGTTLFMTLLATWAVLLARYSGQPDLVVGAPIAHRQDAALGGLIGFCVNALARRVGVDERASAAALLAAVRRTTLDAYAQQDLPFERLVEELAPARRLDQTPLFQVVLALQNAPQEAPTTGAVTVEP